MLGISEEADSFSKKYSAYYFPVDVVIMIEKREQNLWV